MKNIRKTFVALSVTAALFAGYSASSSANAASPGINPLKSPVQPSGCYAKEVLEVRRDPLQSSPLNGLLPSGTQVYIIGRSGAWTNLYGYTYSGYYYYSAQGWTKGKVACR